MKNINILHRYAKNLYLEKDFKHLIFYTSVLLVIAELDELHSEINLQNLSLLEVVENFEIYFSTKFTNYFDEQFWLRNSESILGNLINTNNNINKNSKISFIDWDNTLLRLEKFIVLKSNSFIEKIENKLIIINCYLEAINILQIIDISNISSKDRLGLLGIDTRNKKLVIRQVLNKCLISSCCPDWMINIEPISALSYISLLRKQNKLANNKNNQYNYYSIGGIPENLARLRVVCDSCQLEFSPNWLGIRPPAIPLRSINSDKNNLWIPRKDYDKCPSCQELVEIDLPIKKLGGKVTLFGDEAYREYNSKLVYCYSLVGADNRILSNIENSINNLKSELAPDYNPDSWKLHMKILWSGNHRKKHPIFKNWDFKKVNIAVSKICNLMQSYEPSLFTYNIAYIYQQDNSSEVSKGIKEYARARSYISLIMQVINELTDKNAQPNFIFDAEKNTKAERVIQKWAQNNFLGNQQSLLYSFLSRGIEIPEPIFVKPASHPCLELADFISYIIARFYHRKWQNKNIDLNPSDLGKVTYLGFDRNKNLLFNRAKYYPWDYFYT